MKNTLTTLLLPLTLLTTPQTPPQPTCTHLIHIGDSLTQPNTQQLKTQYQKHGYTNITIDAKNGRSTKTAQQTIQKHKQNTPPTRCWIIALGTNDLHANNKQQRIQQTLQQLGNDPNIWITTYTNSPTRPNYNPLNAYAWNTLLQQNNITTINWHTQIKPTHLQPDGIHYTKTGNTHYTNYITQQTTQHLPPPTR